MVLSNEAIRCDFYQVNPGNKSPCLYESLAAIEEATQSDLRMAWRIKQLETGEESSERSQAERAFNMLAHPDLRTCYDSLLRDGNAPTPAVFPYGGRGSILVEGKLSNGSDAFFAERILAYRPELRRQRCFDAASAMRIPDRLDRFPRARAANWKSGSTAISFPA